MERLITELLQTCELLASIAFPPASIGNPLLMQQDSLGRIKLDLTGFKKILQRFVHANSQVYFSDT